MTNADPPLDPTHATQAEYPPVLGSQRGKTASLATSRQEARLAQLIQTAALGIFSCDPYNRIELFNTAAENIFEVTASDAIGQDCQQFIITRCTDDSRTAIETCIANNLKPGGEDWFSISVIRSDGWLLPSELHCATVNIEGRSYLNFFVRNIDAQTRRFREKQTHLSNLAEKGRANLMSEVASGIAHELNQPLTAITAYLQSSLRLLRSQPDKIDLVLSALEAAATQTLKAGDIIKRMRALIGTRDNETGGFGPFDVNMLITSAVGLIRDDFRDDGIELKLELADQLPQVYCNPLDIEQVLLNLLNNSRQAIVQTSANKGMVSISTSMREPAYVLITLEDTGCGISPDCRDTLIRQGLSPQNLCRGVGLPVSFSIVESHGGRFWLDPDLKEGARFHFTLRTAQT